MKKILPIATILALLVGLSKPAFAASASLFLSPSSASKTVGTSFDVVIKVNSGGVSINTVKAYLSFDAASFKITKIDTGGSFATVWAENEYDNMAGSIRLVGGVKPPGFTGSSGTFATITFQALTPGVGRVSFAENCRIRLTSDSSDIFSLTDSKGGEYTLVGGAGSNGNDGEDGEGNETHLACVGGICAVVAGAGSNLGGCQVEGASCSAGPESGGVAPTVFVFIFGVGLALLGCLFPRFNSLILPLRELALRRFERKLSHKR